MEYLVLSHYAGLCIDHRDKEEILKECECGDSDIIIAAWEDNDIDTMYNELLKYFLAGEILSKESYERMLKIYGATKKDYVQTKDKMICNIYCDIDMHENTINELYSRKEISKKIRDELLSALKLSRRKQIRFIRKYDINQIDFSSFKPQYQRSKKRISDS